MSDPIPLSTEKRNYPKWYDEVCPHCKSGRLKGECDSMLRQDNASLREALKGLSDHYAKTWDRVDGALVMFPDTVHEFENAHSKARIALGEPLVGDDEEESAESVK